MIHDPSDRIAPQVTAEEGFGSQTWRFVVTGHRGGDSRL